MVPETENPAGDDAPDRVLVPPVDANHRLKSDIMRLLRKTSNSVVPDMSVLRLGRRLPPDFPLEALGEPLTTFVRDAAECAGCPPDYVANPLIACAAALVGSAMRVSPWDGWTEPPVIWSANVGDPSSNKSPAFDAVFKVIRDIERDWKAEMADAERHWHTKREEASCVKEHWLREVREAAKVGVPAPTMPEDAKEPPEPVAPRVLISDATPEAMGLLLAAHPRGLLNFRDELTGWFGQFDRYGKGDGEQAFWIEGYGARPYTIDRVKHRSPINIPSLSVGVTGGIQPEKLAEVMTGADDGMLARFLWYWPDPIPPTRPTRNVNLRPIEAAFRRLADLAMEWEAAGGEPIVLALSADAANAFQTWREAHYVGRGTGKLGSAHGKAPGQVLRLALVLEMLWWAVDPTAPMPQAVDEPSIQAAIQMMDAYFKPMAERVFGDAALPEADRLAATLARWIVKNKPPTINLRDIRRTAGLAGLRESARVKMAADVLEEAGWLLPRPSRSGGAPGRQRADYQVNPLVLEATV